VDNVAQFDRKARLHRQAVEQQRKIAEMALRTASAEFKKLHSMDPSTIGQ